MATAQQLDSTIGDIRNDTSVPKVEPTGVHIDAMHIAEAKPDRR
jgi:hypothetical protein